VVRIETRPYDHPDSAALIAEVQQEYVVRYGDIDHTPVDPAEFAPPRGTFLVLYLDDRPTAMGGWRSRPAGAGAEIKRMYVSPWARGRGLSRVVLAELERTAAAAGHRALALETGPKQPEAIALYRSCGYTPVTPFGYFADDPLAVYLGKALLAPGAAGGAAAPR
jgi:GNAT superfamily N-acetyltransferase